eukprot:1158905-Pelagomonas_calceolata.AAC.10
MAERAKPDPWLHPTVQAAHKQQNLREGCGLANAICRFCKSNVQAQRAWIPQRMALQQILNAQAKRQLINIDP